MGVANGSGFSMWYHRVSDSERETIFACVGESGCEMPAAKACMIGVETRSGLDEVACSLTWSGSVLMQGLLTQTLCK